MRKLLAIAGVSLLQTWKDKMFVVIMIAAAVVFTSIAGFIFGGSAGGVRTLVPVAVCDNDRSELSGKMVSALSDTGSYNVRVLSEDVLYQDVRLGKVEAGFVIPSGFQQSVASGSPLSVTVVSLPSSNTGMVAGAIMQKSLSSYLLEKAVVDVTGRIASDLGVSDKVQPSLAGRAAVRALDERPALAVVFEEVKAPVSTKPKATWAAGYSAGVYIMFTMFTVLFQAGDILAERKTGTWGRLLSTPVTKTAVIGGKALGSYVVGLVQILVLLLFGRYVLRTNFGPHFGAVIAIMALMVAVVTALALFLSTMVKTVPQLQTLAPIVIVSTSMLGGCYWPLEIVTPVMQAVAKATPQAWAMTALSDVMLKGRSLSSTVPDLLVLAGFGVVFFVLGASRTKFE